MPRCCGALHGGGEARTPPGEPSHHTHCNRQSMGVSSFSLRVRSAAGAAPARSRAPHTESKRMPSPKIDCPRESDRADAGHDGDEPPLHGPPVTATHERAAGRLIGNRGHDERDAMAFARTHRRAQVAHQPEMARNGGGVHGCFEHVVREGRTTSRTRPISAIMHRSVCRAGAGTMPRVSSTPCETSARAMQRAVPRRSARAPDRSIAAPPAPCDTCTDMLESRASGHRGARPGDRRATAYVRHAENRHLALRPGRDE